MFEGDFASCEVFPQIVASDLNQLPAFCTCASRRNSYGGLIFLIEGDRSALPAEKLKDAAKALSDLYRRCGGYIYGFRS